MEKVISNILIYQPETNTFIGMILEDTIALHGKRYFFIICIYLPETGKFIEMRVFPTMHLREFLCVQGNTLSITLRDFLSISVN